MAFITPFTALPFETPKTELTQIALREQHERATTLAGTPLPKVTSTPIPTLWPPPTPYWPNVTPISGGGTIIDLPRRVQGLNFDTNNAWGYMVDATHILMVQGVHGSGAPPASDVQQGGVIVSIILNTNDSGRPLQSQDYYPTPNTSGDARIIDAVVRAGVQRVLVHTDGGSTFIFNVITRQWEPGTVLPTPAPATYTSTRMPLPGTPTLPASTTLRGTRWVLTTLHGTVPLSGTQITLAFDGAQLRGFGGCNRYGGSYTTSSTALTIGDIASSAVGCDTPEGVLHQETTYTQVLLHDVVAYHMSRDTLQLMNTTGAIVLVFRHD